jgi:hypothetical protein
VFLGNVRERGGQLDGEPVRDPAADRDGRFGWDLPMVGGHASCALDGNTGLSIWFDQVAIRPGKSMS